VKSETRVLVSSCSDDYCAGFIVRGDGIDGFIIGRSCEELCRRASERGFTGELRYSLGNCGCGYPEAPIKSESIYSYARLAAQIAILARSILKTSADDN